MLQEGAKVEKDGNRKLCVLCVLLFLPLKIIRRTVRRPFFMEVERPAPPAESQRGAGRPASINPAADQFSPSRPSSGSGLAVYTGIFQPPACERYYGLC